MDEDGRAVDGTVDEDGAVGGDAGDAEAGAELVGHAVGEADGEEVGTTMKLGGGAEGTVGLGAVHPYPLSDADRLDAVADRSMTPAASLWGMTRG